jgi:hypothetical protein
MGQRGVYSSDMGWGQVAGCCEHGGEHSGYTKWSLARRPVVRGVGCWAVYFRLTCVQGSRIPEVDCIRRIMSMKNSSDTIWDRTSDLLICSAVP